MSFNETLMQNINNNNAMMTWFKNGGAPALGGGAPTITATAISQDQINISWTPEFGKGIQIERSELAPGPFNTVIFYPFYESSVKIYSHQPNTQYYYRAKFVSPAGESSYSGTMDATTVAAVNTYHVKTTGNDTTGNGSDVNPYLTIQKGVHVATAGDVVNVHGGSYTELGTQPGGAVVNFSNIRAGIAMTNSGTPTAPVIVQANPGDERTVIIDQGVAATGFAFVDAAESATPWPDYVHIKGFDLINCEHNAIGSRDNNLGSFNLPDASVCRGVVVEDNKIRSTNQSITGINSGAIRADNHRDWVIRNNDIDASILQGGGLDVNGSGCVFSFGGYGAVIEYNNFQNGYSAVHPKDTANDAPAFPSIQNIVRYNRCQNFQEVFLKKAGGEQDLNNGYDIVTHNLFIDVTSAAVILDQKQQSRLDYNHNFCDYKARVAFNIAIGPSDLSVLPKILNLEGNIWSNSNGGKNYALNDDFGRTDLQNTDYNLYESGPDASVDRAAAITSLATWQAFSGPMVSDPIPDEHSLANQALATLATNTAIGDYTIPNGSPALAFMPDGSNAGPYQYGGEIIGVVP